MKRYPLLSMTFIVLFFAFLAATIFWQVTEKKRQEEQKEQVIPEPKITVKEKKDRFKALIIPAVNAVHADLQAQYKAVSDALIADDNNDTFVTLRKKYKVENNDELLMALKPHPQSIAIAQAAMESSWATSRFFTEANNIFGVWSFSENEPRLAAEEKRGDKTIWVKKYDSIESSIRDYYRTLAKGGAYKEFRVLKMETNDPYELVKKLDRYSEKGAAYGEELSAIIRFNKFDIYDQHEPQSKL